MLDVSFFLSLFFEIFALKPRRLICFVNFHYSSDFFWEITRRCQWCQQRFGLGGWFTRYPSWEVVREDCHPHTRWLDLLIEGKFSVRANWPMLLTAGTPRSISYNALHRSLYLIWGCGGTYRATSEAWDDVAKQASTSRGEPWNMLYSCSGSLECAWVDWLTKHIFIGTPYSNGRMTGACYASSVPFHGRCAM